MQALVCVKRVVDPYAKIQVKADGTGIQDQNLKMVMNPFDEIALEEALRMRERQELEHITVVTIGKLADQEVLRHALALGADTAILLKTDAVLAPLARARALTSIVQAQGIALVWMGKQAIDEDYNQCGQMLAELLGWHQGCFVSKVVKVDKQLRVTQEVDQGLETITIPLPCVLTADLRLNEPRYATLPNIMKARQKPLEIIELPTSEPLMQLLEVTVPSVRTPGKIVSELKTLLTELKL